MRKYLYLLGAAWAACFVFAYLAFAGPPFMAGPSVAVVVPPGPVAQWMLNSASITGTTVADASGSGNTATVVAGPLSFPGTSTPPVLGAQFNGSSQYIDNASISTAGWSAITISGWFYATSLGGASPNQYPSLVDNSHSASDNNGFDFHLNGPSGGGTCDIGNGTTASRALWTTALSLNTWYFYVCTYDGTTIRSYVNAVEVVTAALTGPLTAGTGPHINVANNAAFAGNLFPGYAYDVRVYNRALSASEITALFNANTTTTDIAFATNPVTVSDTAPANTVVTTFSVITANATSYSGTPTGACATQSPCPLAVQGSSGAWKVGTPAALNSSYDATNLAFNMSASGVNKALTYSVTPVGSIACDWGTNETAIPTAANRANFTHCGLNADFTQSSGMFSAIANFLYPCGASQANWPTTSAWNAQYYFNHQVGGGKPPCNRYTIVNDPDGVTGQVLHIHFDTADFNPNDKVHYVAMDFPYAYGEAPSQRRMLPMMGYFKITYKIPVGLNQGIGQPGNNNANLGPNFWNSPQQNGPFGSSVSLELDFNEILAGGGGFPSGPWGNAWAGIGQPLYNTCHYTIPGSTCNDGSTYLIDWAHYHTEENVITSDGSTVIYNCGILDGVYQICNTNAASADADHLSWPGNVIEIAIGVGCAFQVPNIANSCVTGNSDAYIKQIEYFACNSYQTTSCADGNHLVSGP